MDQIAFIAGAAAVGILIGGMVFFPSVVAPSVFASLDADKAGAFLRSMFPRYYAFMIIASLIAAVALYAIPTAVLLMSLIAVSTLWVRQSLMPSINLARDEGREGDFKKKHLISVAINMVQLVLAIWVGVNLLL